MKLLRTLHKQPFLKEQNTSSFDAFMAVMFQVKVFWVVTPFSVVVGFQNSIWENTA
jgi:hypothetical protein